VNVNWEGLQEAVVACLIHPSVYVIEVEIECMCRIGARRIPHHQSCSIELGPGLWELLCQPAWLSALPATGKHILMYDGNKPLDQAQ